MRVLSAGIEKFYTLPQFLGVEVTFLCQVALAVEIVRLLAYGRSRERTARFGLLLSFILLWCVDEMLCAVAPSALHLQWYLEAGSVLPLMPVLILMTRPRKEGAGNSLLLFPALFAALFIAVVIIDRTTGLVLGSRGLFSLPTAQALYWVPPSAAAALAVCTAVADMAGKERNCALDAGMLTLYGAYLVSRLTASILPFDPFIVLLPFATALVIRGVEIPMERMLTVSRAGKVMQCLPESVFVFRNDMSLSGGNGGPMTGLLGDCGTLGQTLERLRSLSARWTLDELDEWILTGSEDSAAYCEGELSLTNAIGNGIRDCRIGIGPVTDPAGLRGYVLVIQDITAHRAALQNAERAYMELRAVQSRLEHYARATMPREVERENREQLAALRERMREQLQDAAARIGGLRRGSRIGGTRAERIAEAAAAVRACLSDVRGTVGRLRGESR